MICKRWDVVRLTLPYLEGHDANKRPALIVSTESLTSTTAKRGALPEDIVIKDPEAAGLPEDCVIRPSRLFTISEDLLERRLGAIKQQERIAVTAFLKRHMP